VDFKTKAVEHRGDSHCGGLLTIHADRECFYTTQKQETVERGKGIADCIDDESYLLKEYFQQVR
jgi:hypothetical protein